MAEDEHKEYFVELLENYKNHICLWDTRNSLYSNRDSRNQAYNSLLEIYKKIKADATVTDLKKKLDNMRTTFNREAKKVKESIVNGSGAHQVYIPKLWYYEYLLFLNEKEIGNTSWIHESSREGRIPEQENTTDSGLYYLTDENDTKWQAETGSNITATPTTLSTGGRDELTSHKKNRFGTLMKKQEQLIETAQSLLKCKNNPLELLGTSFGMQLQELKGDQQAIAQKLMSDVLFYGKMNRLTEFSTIQLLPCPHNSVTLPVPSHSCYSPAPSPSCATLQNHNVKLQEPPIQQSDE